jgi:hypothetical protein
MKEIDDNEIRIIGSTDRGRRHRWPWYGWLAVGLVLAALVAVTVAVLLLQTPREEAVGADATQPLNHSATQSLSHSVTQPLRNSETQKLSHSETQPLRNTVTP